MPVILRKLPYFDNSLGIRHPASVGVKNAYRDSSVTCLEMTVLSPVPTPEAPMTGGLAKIYEILGDGTVRGTQTRRNVKTNINNDGSLPGHGGDDRHLGQHRPMAR